MHWRENNMTSKELNLRLKYALPEIKELYDDETSWQDGDNTGSHIVYGDVFAPFIKEQIKFNNKIYLKQLFQFIEDLLLLNDKYTDEVISFSVIESLLFDGEITKNMFIQYVGQKTLKIIAEIERD